MSRKIKSISPLQKKARKGFRGYPAATVAYYGPDSSRASKVAVGIKREEGADIDPLERWFSEEGDVRRDHLIQQEILEFIKANGVRSIVITDGIIGCPHEEGIDYPEGQACPKCPYWRGRDRWTDTPIQ